MVAINAAEVSQSLLIQGATKSKMMVGDMAASALDSTPPHTPAPKPTYVRAMVKWNRCRSPLKVRKEWAGKLRVLIWQ